ncbi:hypothetical protein Xbed_03626 [Xenorhabdus beddingii]|uniref:DUF2591 domain-containing protein n=1 Tax=Xenorhabdus beddingii TaxID=40578 RepID=A0A1Y2SAR6_9GAMM|nr:phage protein NinX family protein [Xenorhabdus beddingii]OTA15015.1 hypothetical protein Xbed_03626 [Xenorhabdus beddingii]
MKIKTSELTGRALDWAVARATRTTMPSINQWIIWDDYHPSTNWLVCGQLIEEFSIRLGHALLWSANCHYVSDDYLDGETPQIAICRAVVAAKLGEEVDIPDEIFDWSEHVRQRYNPQIQQR